MLSCTRLPNGWALEGKELRQIYCDSLWLKENINLKYFCLHKTSLLTIFASIFISPRWHEATFK